MPFLAFALMLLAVIATPAAGGPPVPTSAPAADQPSISQLINELASPSWRKREVATDALMDRGCACFDRFRSSLPAANESPTADLLSRGDVCWAELREAFKTTRSYEVRRRIKRIVQEIYFTDSSATNGSFLGIRMLIQKNPKELRLLNFSEGIHISGTMECTAAEKAGLRRGDLWITLNGKWCTPVPEDTQNRQFPDWIKAQRPGTHCHVGILRGGKGLIVNLDNKSTGFDIKDLDKLQTKTMLHNDDPRIPPDTAGLLITEVTPAAKALNLESGDLIFAMNQKRLPTQGAREQLLQWTKPPPPPPPAPAPAPAPANPPAVQPGAPNPPPKPEAHDLVHQLHVLRGGKYMEFEVALGRRSPVYGASGPIVQPGENARRERAATDFPLWWREHFDPEGLVGEIDADGDDPRWTLEPTRGG